MSATLRTPAFLSSLGLLFPEDFDASSGVTVVQDNESEPDEILPRFGPEDIQAAHERGYADGMRDGQTRASHVHATTVLEILSSVARRLADARTEAARLSEEAAGSVANVLLAAFGAALPAICSRHGPGEVAAFARAILPALHREPRVTIRVHPDAVTSLQIEIDRLDRDVKDAIIIAPSDGVAPADIRVLWQDGAAVRDVAALWRSVTEALAPLGVLRATDLAGTVPHHEVTHG